MFEESAVELKKISTVLDGEELHNDILACKVHEYAGEDEYIFLLIRNEDLRTLSLNGIYEGKIFGKDNIYRFEGMIRERYLSEDGQVLAFEIQKGFYLE
ncbi:MAG: hypothetical protein LBQ95_05875 [Lachnospiraceae bacterium]|jgi:hypothetical protein|nr:hypothetical protein [Lachnospiraceae bacterium]